MEKKIVCWSKNKKLLEYPELVKEFNFNRNNILPDIISDGYRKKIWWICKKFNCEFNCNHEWESTVRCRTKRNHGCPYCSGRLICKHNSFAYKYSTIINKLINIDKNMLNLYTISPKSNKKIILTCLKQHCEKGCLCDWEATIYDITRIDGKATGCPMCGGKVICKHKSVKYNCPNIMKYWDYNEPRNKNPETVSQSSGLKIYFKCPKFNCEEKCAHVWKKTISKIKWSLYDFKCPYCNNQKICKHNSLLYKYPNLINNEWNWKLNKRINPEEIFPFSNKHANWTCLVCKHIWKCQIISRTRLNSGCPKCVNLSRSKVSIEWLKFMEIRDNTNIQTYESKEYCIKGKKYKVDGYSKDLNKVYEFNGDLWHGHLKYPRNKIIFNKSMKERYDYTFNRKKEIIALGYNFEDIWEHDWNIVKKNVIKIQKWWKNLKFFNSLQNLSH